MTDRVEHVEATYNAGISSYRGVGPAFGVSTNGNVAVGVAHQSGIIVSGLSRELSPFPVMRKAGGRTGFGILSLMIGLLEALVFFGVILSGNATMTLKITFAMSVGLWLIVGVTLLVSASRAASANALRKSLLARVLDVWCWGWFCHRCGSAFYPTATPYAVPTGVRLEPNVFQRWAWHAASTGRSSSTPL